MAAPVSRHAKPNRSGIAAAAGCLAELLVWWVILPCAIAFMVAAYYFSPVGFIGVIIVIVVAACAVLLTATVGYLRAKRAAIERQMRDEEDPSAENP